MAQPLPWKLRATKQWGEKARFGGGGDSLGGGEVEGGWDGGVGGRVWGGG